MSAINIPTIIPCKDLRINIATMVLIWIVPSITNEMRHKISVKFLRLRKNYLLLAKGITNIEIKEPNIAPIVRQPISKPLAIGCCISSP